MTEYGDVTDDVGKEREEAVENVPAAARASSRKTPKKSGAAEVAASSAPSRAQRKTAPRVPAPDCPRWMHHRQGEYCKACGKIP